MDAKPLVCPLQETFLSSDEPQTELSEQKHDQHLPLLKIEQPSISSYLSKFNQPVVRCRSRSRRRGKVVCGNSDMAWPTCKDTSTSRNIQNFEKAAFYEIQGAKDLGIDSACYSYSVVLENSPVAKAEEIGAWDTSVSPISVLEDREPFVNMRSGSLDCDQPESTERPKGILIEIFFFYFSVCNVLNFSSPDFKFQWL